MEPSLVLDFDDLSEALVLWELAVDATQVLFVHFKDLNEAVHAHLVPPTTCLHDSEATSKDVSHITTASNIRG